MHLRAPGGRRAALAQRSSAWPPGAPVFHTLIVHFENGVPLQCEDRYVNPACAPDYLGVDFTQTTPTHVPVRGDRAVARAVLDRGRAAHARRRPRCCGIGADEPCLVVVRRTFTRDAAITIARLVHPGSRYPLQGEFTP